MNTERQRLYARLIAEKGVNVKKDQDVIIRAQLDQPGFVEMVTEECYRLGARMVEVEWRHQPLTALHVAGQAPEVLGGIEDWEYARLQHYVDTLPARIVMISEDPDGLNGIDQEKYAAAMQSIGIKCKSYGDAMDNKHQWCIAAVPGKAWARKVFPDLAEDEAVERLWEAILDTSRVTGDPIAAWDDHNRNLSQRCGWLNSLGLTALEYKAGNGTNLRVGLMPEGLFLGGGENTLSGRYYNPNIPSEEIFTTPKRGEAEGIVYSTKPLSYQGELIEDFWVRFEGGKAVETGAAKNNHLLEKLISMDKGAAYLGECALVPFDSPISNSGLLFYNTLFDENASCHLALGMGFTNCVKGFEELGLEKCRELGVNDSIVHTDFMIGTADLSITGITGTGERVEIFRGGNWAGKVEN